jgi:hypothetical protein
MIRSAFPWLTTSLLLTTALTAQTQSVPDFADAVDGHHSLDMPFGVPGFRTQIVVDLSTVAANTVVLTGLRFRADRPSSPLTATTVPNVTVTLSQTAAAVGNLVTTFNNNVSGNLTVVFQGSVSLPAHNHTGYGPLPWDIVVPIAVPYVALVANGNLLIDIVGNNPPGQFASYWLDAVQGGGSANPFGAAGDNPSSDFLNLIASTNNGAGLEPMSLVPGSAVEYTSTLSFTQPPGFLLLGLLPQTVPLDLGPIGAPTHHVYVDPLAYVAHSWQQSFIGRYSTVQVAIPSDQSFVGLQLYAQSALLDPTANAAGVLTSAAIETRIGSALVPLALQQLNSDDPAATDGALVDFSFGGALRYGSVPLQLEGAFQ